MAARVGLAVGRVDEPAAVHRVQGLPLLLREGLARRVNAHVDARHAPGMHPAVPSLTDDRGGGPADHWNAVHVARHDAALSPVEEASKPGYRSRENPSGP